MSSMCRLLGSRHGVSCIHKAAVMVSVARGGCEHVGLCSTADLLGSGLTNL